MDKIILWKVYEDETSDNAFTDNELYTVDFIDWMHEKLTDLLQVKLDKFNERNDER